MGKRKKWKYWSWDSDYYDERRESGYSASSWWTSRFGGSDWYDSSAKDGQYKEAIRTVSRTVNVFSYKEHDKLRELTVQWSDGQTGNTIEGGIVYLSPDVISSSKTLKKDWSNDQLVDALIGDALTASAFKYEATVTAEAYANKKWDGQKDTTDLWYVLEILAARTSVLAHYPGFAAYFAASLEYYTMTDIYDRMKELALLPPMADAACRILEWSLLHPDKPITAKNAEYGTEIEQAAKRVRKARNSNDRAIRAREVAERFYKLWPPPPSPESDGGDGEEGEGKAKGGGSSSSNIPTIGQCGAGAVHGKPVVNSVSAKLAIESAKAADGTPEAHGVSLGDDPPEGYYDHKIRDTEERRTAYTKLTAETRGHSDALAQRLKLRNEVRSEFERGLKTGALDPGALYKISITKKYGVVEDGIFEQKTILAHPQVAIALLVDESGSMASLSKQARELAVLLANGLAKVRGTNFAVLGHTGQGVGADRVGFGGLLLHHYFTPGYQRLQTTGGIAAYCENLDGYAIKRVGEYMLTWWPSVPLKFLIHISDGFPAANNYGGSMATNHIKKICGTLRMRGIRPFQVMLGAFEGYDLSAMFGGGNWATVKEARDVVKVVVNYVARVTRECPLVEEES